MNDQVWTTIVQFYLAKVVPVKSYSSSNVTKYQNCRVFMFMTLLYDDDGDATYLSDLVSVVSLFD